MIPREFLVRVFERRLFMARIRRAGLSKSTSTTRAPLLFGHTTLGFSFCNKDHYFHSVNPSFPSNHIAFNCSSARLLNTRIDINKSKANSKLFNEPHSCFVHNLYKPKLYDSNNQTIHISVKIKPKYINL